MERQKTERGPSFLPERTGLEELDAKEVNRHRYSGQYPGEPGDHFLGGSHEITFGGDDSRVSERWDRLRNFLRASDKQKAWRNAYHQIGFIADRLDLPSTVRDDVCRAYAKMREKGKVKEGRRSLEEVLGLLTYVACRIHRYPRKFQEVEKTIQELYGEEIEKSDLQRDMVKSFNKGPRRFGIMKQNGRRYLCFWNRKSGRKKNHRSLGSI